MAAIDPDTKHGSRYGNSYLITGCIYWVAVFILYLPASQAGRVGDFPGWVTFLNSVNFIDYINRSESGIASLYQFTQVVTLLFYKIIGANAWCWHLLYVTLQAINALLVFTLFRRLFDDSGMRNSALVAFTGALLFCICPHISEVVVWEPAFHYLLGFLLMLVVIICAQNYINTGKVKFAWWGGIVFFLSTYSLEVFYLTPFFVLTLVLYYRLALNCDKTTVAKALLFFLLPQVVFFILNLALLRIIYHESVAHIGSFPLQPNVNNFSKALKYIFHIIFFGRYFPIDVRRKVYHFCEAIPVLLSFYGLLIIVFVFLGLRMRKMSVRDKTVALLFLWMIAAVGLIIPLWFPDTGLALLDRYTYVPDAFIFMFLALSFSTFTSRYVFAAIASIYALLNIRFTHRVVAYWEQSSHIVNNLVYTFPNDPAKKILLLNLPECLDGVQMIGSRDEGEFRMMYNAIMPQKANNPVYDVEAFYLQSPADGAHVMVLNDSTLRVTLNQWGTWWLYYGFGARSYTNSDYRVDMKDPGHSYDVIIKHPINEYLVLYVIGDEWKRVDWQKKNVDQY